MSSNIVSVIRKETTSPYQELDRLVDAGESDVELPQEITDLMYYLLVSDDKYPENNADYRPSSVGEGHHANPYASTPESREHFEQFFLESAVSAVVKRLELSARQPLRKADINNLSDHLNMAYDVAKKIYAKVEKNGQIAKTPFLDTSLTGKLVATALRGTP